jgi:Tol biopolymer transport system component
VGALLRTAVAGACLAALALAPPAQAAFPGANGKIAFAHSAGDGGLQIYTINPDGTGLTPLTSGPGSSFSPAWSPDGRKIAFTSVRDDPNLDNCYSTHCNYEIYVMDADGGNQTRLTSDPSRDRDPQWSPDGTKIVFDSDRTGGGDIYSMNADGSGLVRLTTDPGRDSAPAWSPDGTKIAFSGGFQHPAYPYDQGQEILLMNPDGSGRTTVTGSSGYAPCCDQDNPDWSPDGSMIAYEESDCVNGAGMCDSNGHFALRIRIDGTGDTALEGGSGPAWSPDGSRIVVAHEECTYVVGLYFCSPIDLVTMNPDRSGRVNLTNDSRVLDSEPSWQPIANRPPDCSGVAVSRPVLMTVNHKLVPITLDGATDPDGDAVTLSVDGVTQDEPVVGSGDHTSPDAVDQGEGELRVRAERNPHGDGRVYRIAFTASDGRGGSCSDTATVSVPRKKRKPAVDSAPPSYDSLLH